MPFDPQAWNARCDANRDLIIATVEQAGRSVGKHDAQCAGGCLTQANNDLGEAWEIATCSGNYAAQDGLAAYSSALKLLAAPPQQVAA